MSEPDLSALRERAEEGDADAVDELIELACEQGNLEELRRLADQVNSTAADQLTSSTGEHVVLTFAQGYALIDES